MRKNFVIINFILVFGLFLIGTLSVSQAATPATCTVNKVIQTTGITRLVLTEVNGVFTQKLFDFKDSANLNRMIAVALSAAVSDCQIKIYFDNNEKIISIQLIK